MDLAGATLVFDLDGTLIDTAPDLVGTLNDMLEAEGMPPLPLASARHMVGHGARALLIRGFEAAGVRWAPERDAELNARFIEVYLARVARESRPFPGMEDVLDGFARRGASLAVCTNKRTDLSLALLEAVGLADRFAAVVGADYGGPRKPDAAHLQAAIEAAGGDPSRAVMVGDSDTDVGAARAAGVPCVVFTFGYCATPVSELGADAVLDRWSDLPATADRLLQSCERRAPAV